MPPSAHFFLGFAVSLLIAAVGAGLVLLNSTWLNEHGIPPNITMFAVFLLLQLISRATFKAIVKVRCPYGCGNSGYPIKGRADRFRCDKCGMDF